MMRSLWTAASGMTAQQLSIDNISNNISNVNTYGYKKTNLEFKDLLYSNLRETVIDSNGEGAPTSLQVGYGVRVGATTRDFTTGTLSETTNVTDFAIQGEGFFAVRDAKGTEKYTKDGSFKVSPFEGQNYLVTSDGYRVLNVDDEPITIDEEVRVSTIAVDNDGIFSYRNDQGELVELGQRLKIVQFTNVMGLENAGNNLYQATPASGTITLESELEEGTRSIIRQKCIELSNVQIAEEMVNMIVTQRAYELNSKSIQTSDDMLSIANQLKR